MKHSTYGFTLVEILVIVAVLSIFSSLLVPLLRGAQKRSYDTGALMCARSIQTVQSVSQVDNKTFMSVGTGEDHLNRTSDGLNQACKQTDVFVKDRSNADNIVSNYVVDVWDRRGSKVFTATSGSLHADASGFSGTGTGGINLP